MTGKPMMPSNAYIATDGETVMKVGKANDVKRREKQLAVPITYSIACLDEEAAYRVEDQLRDFVVKRGGIQHRGTVDWFKFDHQIYQMLCEFAVGFDGGGDAGCDLDAEIDALRARYYTLVTAEAAKERDAALEQAHSLEAQINASVQYERQLARKLEQAQSELEKKCEVIERDVPELYDEGKIGLVNRYKQREAELREKYEKLLREIGRLEGIIAVKRPQGGKAD
jgi:hypothetical protein